MSLPIRILPIAEQWDCQGCGKCCRGSVIPLDAADRQRIEQQRWRERPEFRETPVIVRSGWLSGEYELARRDDGRCVFLTEENRCQIHELHGEAAKPLVCRLYPLQIVPLEKHALLTTRRSCPAAAGDQGRALSAHLPEAKRLAELRGLVERPSPPPAITRRWRRGWPEANAALVAIERLLCDQRWPLVRRLAHGLIFCRLLDQAKLRAFDTARFAELVDVLAEAAPDEVGELFRNRQPPSKAAAVLFRQTAAEYVRLQPQFQTQSTWRSRWLLTKAAFAIVRGKGDFPLALPGGKKVAFSRLEEPLGPLPEETGLALTRYFETTAATRQYAVLGRKGWAITERFRALALGYAIAQWMMRLTMQGEPPSREDALQAIAAIERGQGYGPLEGSRHRSRVQSLSALEQLPVLLAWYAR